MCYGNATVAPEPRYNNRAMPTRLFTAPAASGKTAHCVALAREAAAGLRAEVRICVPTTLQAMAWRNRLAAEGGALGVHVLPYDRLVAACLNAARETYTEINPQVQFHLLRRIINRQPLVHYAPLRDKPGFVQVTQQLIEELKSARIDPPTFAAAVRQIDAGPRLLELAAIYDAYQTRLREQAWADRVGLSWLAVEALTERAPAACRDWPLLIIDGFDDFTPIQLDLFAALAGRVHDFILTLPQATQLDFPRHARTRTAVEAALGVAAQPLPPHATTACHPALAHLGSRIFGRTAGEPLQPVSGAVARQELPDAAAEVRAALRWLKGQMVAHGLRPSDVALMARDLTPYQRFIEPIAAEFGLPVRLEGGLPLLQSPVVAALFDLMRAHLPVNGVAGLPRREVVALWRSPYFDWAGGEMAIGAGDADWLDRMGREFRVIRGEGQWRAAFAAAERAWAAEEDAAMADEADLVVGARPSPAVAAALRAKFDHFLARTAPPTGTHSLTDFVRWLEELIGPDGTAAAADARSLRVIDCVRTAGGAVAAADIAALRALKDVLRGLVWAEAAVGQVAPLDFAGFYAELAGALRSSRFQLPIQTNDDVVLATPVVMGRGLGFEAVAVLGLGEGSFPTTVSEDPFLRDDDRARLRETAGLSLLPSALSAEREFFYEAITRPRRALLLTRSVLADNGADWVASPFWEAVGALVTCDPQRIPTEHALSPEHAASWAELWESAAIQPAAAAWAAAQQPATWDHIGHGAQLWRDRRTRRPTPYDGHTPALAGALADQFGGDFIWSASRLEAYRSCRFRFFTGSVLRLEPRPEPAEGLDPRQLGSVYHRILEAVYRRGLPDPAAGEFGALVSAVAEPILDAAPEADGFRESAWWPQTRQAISDTITRSIEALETLDSDFRFLLSEAAFGIRDRPPLVIRDGDEQLRVRGFIDRVDRDGEGRLRIIDYKTSGPTGYKADEFRDGKKLQLPLYALAAEQALGLGQVSDGFYWHVKQAEASPFQLATEGVSDAVDLAVAYAWAVAREVREGHFTPHPPDDGCPDFCGAAAFCYHYAPKGW